MMRARTIVAAVAAALGLSAAPSSAVLDLQLAAGGPALASCLYVTWAPNDASRMFLLNRFGRILIFKNGAVQPTPFLDISSETLPDYLEQGLLGMCFDPAYATNGWFYVYFIKGTPGGGGNGVSTVRRYTVSANPDVADPSSAHAIFAAAQPQVNHNGGTILFGPDGNLWLALGDGGTGGWRSQNLLDPMGKMLRFDVHGDDFPADPNRNYAIPPDNPFVGNPSALPEVWSYGFRNPYRFTFDRLTGDLWIGDVGFNAFEEIDWQPASSSGGENYGWDFMEGFSCFNPPTDCNDGSLTLPIHDYPHATAGCYSVTGGTVYRGTALGGAFQGVYFFADFCDTALPGFQGRIYSLRWNGSQVTELTEWTLDLDPPGPERLIFPSAVVEDPAGEIYIVEYRGDLGEIWKIVPQPNVVSAPVADLPPLGPGISRLSLGPSVPNPSRGGVRWDLAMEGTRANVAARVVDSGGRLVRRLAAPAASGPIEWDGRDAAGHPAAAGVYFLRVETDGLAATGAVTRIR